MADLGSAAGSGILGSLLTLGTIWAKAVFTKYRNGNGHNKPVAFWENKFEKLGEEVKKGFDSSLAANIAPILQRQTDILERMEQGQEKLTEILVKLNLREEVKAELRRAAKGAS